MEEEGELLDLGGYPEITGNGIGAVHVHGSITEVIYFRWKKIEGIWRRVVSGAAFRPTETVLPSMSMFQSAIRSAKAQQH